MPNTRAIYPIRKNRDKSSTKRYYYAVEADERDPETWKK